MNIDQKVKIIEDVFREKGLHSLSYKGACLEAVNSVEKQSHTNNISNLLISWEQYKKANWYKSDAVDVEKALMEQFSIIYHT